MSTFKYLTVVVAVLAAAFFLSHQEENNTFVVNSYAGVMPGAISVLSMSLPKNWGG
jgi:hypothetical protein